MERQQIPEAGSDRVMEKGTWRLVNQDGEWVYVTLSCPGCGGLGNLGNLSHPEHGSGHTISANGDVNPSVVCPDRCGYHEWCTLAGWDPARVPARS